MPSQKSAFGTLVKLFIAELIKVSQASARSRLLFVANFFSQLAASKTQSRLLHVPNACQHNSHFFCNRLRSKSKTSPSLLGSESRACVQQLLPSIHEPRFHCAHICCCVFSGGQGCMEQFATFLSIKNITQRPAWTDLRRLVASQKREDTGAAPSSTSKRVELYLPIFSPTHHICNDHKNLLLTVCIICPPPL